MIKYIEAPDIHANKKWMETTIEILERIRLTAIKEKVDFIAFPGDLHDAGFYVSNESGYNVFKAKIKELLKVCPVVAVRGTPGHEEEGIYSPLEDLGLVLLQPGRVYGYYTEWGVKELDTGISGGSDGLCKSILFGIPELNKNNIMKELSISAEQGNAEAVTQFGNYIDEFIAPMRLKYKDIPALGLIHGVISDSRKEYSTDIIIKSSDIVIDTETMGRAHLERWIIGHPHKPWESKIINAGTPGYPGIDRNPWGKRDFVPAMNLVEITREMLPSKGYSQTITIDRIPYGTPMRKKITHITEAVPNPNIAYWLVSEEKPENFPGSFNIHPWSRHTFPENTTETRRVTSAEAESAKTLWDLFKLIDPDVRPELKPLIDSIPERKNSKSNHKLDAVLTRIKIWGCTVLFGDKTVEWDLTKLETGLNQLIGTNGNGDGKSSALGFISWHPAIVGKDTKSGRLSAVKDFFTKPDSGYEKYGIVNGHEHHHKITIKGAHTQNPKTECYLWIDGISQLEKATFDTMFEKCQELYGDYEDYLLTTFYEQPQQSKNQRSGLMTATGTDARNLVQNIADIDKESEKRFALDHVARLEKEAGQLDSDIRALEEYSEDVEELEKEMLDKSSCITINNVTLKDTEKKGNTAKVLVDSLQVKVTENEKAKTQKEQTDKNITFVENAIKVSVNRIDKLKETVKDLPGNQAIIKKDDEALKLKTDADKLQLEYSTALNRYNRWMGTYEKKTIRQDSQKENKKSTISKFQTLTSNVLDEIGKLKKVTMNLEANEESIKNDDEALRLKADADKKELEYSTALNKYNLVMQKYNSACIDQNNSKREYQAGIDNSEMKKQSHNKEIELISEPCEKCGYIKPDVQEKISSLNNSITLLDDSIKMSFDNIEALKPIQKPTVTEPVKPEETSIMILSDFNRTAIQKLVKEGLHAESDIKRLDLESRARILQIKEVQKELDSFPVIQKPTATEPVKPEETDITTLSEFERSVTMDSITEGLKAETTIEGMEVGIIKDSKLLEVYQGELKAIVIDPLLDEALATANTDLETVRHLYSETMRTISTLEAEKKALEDRIKKALEGVKTLKEKKVSLTITETSLINWTYIAKMLNPDKIPALELDMVVDSIDAEATRTIEPFLEGRYSYHTITQAPGKKTTVDKFDVLIHDGETGEKFSMFYTNPGNKAFYSDCYIKALIRKRNERQQRSYGPIINDEGDGPVNPLRVKAYWDINQEFFRDQKVILVSQKDITSSYVEKVFNIEEMKS